jgi:hypothetical protein
VTGGPFLKAALLVDADICRNDAHRVEMIVDPFHDAIGSGRAAHPRRGC